MTKPKLNVRPPPVDPTIAQQFIATGNVSERPQTSADTHIVMIPPPAADAPNPLQTPAGTRKRAPKGSKVLVEREHGRVRRRMTIYVEPKLADEFMTWCASNGREASYAAQEAIALYLKTRRGK